MPANIKLWQRDVDPTNLTSSLKPIETIDHLDKNKPILICLPGVSTTHDKQRETNGYMGVAEEVLGGRGASSEVQIISLSYNSTQKELEHLRQANENPYEYYSDGAKEFAEKVFIPLLKKGVDINFYAKSYGSIFSRMVTNYTRRELKESWKSYQVRLVVTGNVARMNLDHSIFNMSAFYFDGINDTRANRLNRYKTDIPANHNNLTITAISSDTLYIPEVLQVNVTVPKEIKYIKHSAIPFFSFGVTKDNLAHTTRLNSSRDIGGKNLSQVDLLERITRNMLRLRDNKFGVIACLEPSPPFVQQCHDIDNDNDVLISSAVIEEALARGERNKQIMAVFFDWDLTIANGEELNLFALNKTFAEMAQKGYRVIGFKDWDMEELREKFLHTVDKFFGDTYKKFGNDAVKMAKDLFRKTRAENRDKVSLLPNAKETLLDLMKENVKVAIVSNKDEDELRELVKIHFSDPEFTDLVITGKTKDTEGKPSPEPIFMTLEKLGLPRDYAPSVLMVGDRITSDLQAAHEAGCKSCLMGVYDMEDFYGSGFARNVLFDSDDFGIVQDHEGREVIYCADFSVFRTHFGLDSKNLELATVTR